MVCLGYNMELAIVKIDAIRNSTSVILASPKVLSQFHLFQTTGSLVINVLLSMTTTVMDPATVGGPGLKEAMFMTLMRLADAKDLLSLPLVHHLSQLLL